MDTVFNQLVQKLNDYVGNLIDVASMSDEDKTALKDHLLAAEAILVANGNVKLQEVLSALTHSFLSRL